jgi:hypothetical protein
MSMDFYTSLLDIKMDRMARMYGCSFDVAVPAWSGHVLEMLVSFAHWPGYRLWIGTRLHHNQALPYTSSRDLLQSLDSLEWDYLACERARKTVQIADAVLEMNDKVAGVNARAYGDWVE